MGWHAALEAWHAGMDPFNKQRHLAFDCSTEAAEAMTGLRPPRGWPVHRLGGEAASMRKSRDVLDIPKQQLCILLPSDGLC